MHPVKFSQSINLGGEHFFPDKTVLLIFSSLIDLHLFLKAKLKVSLLKCVWTWH